MSGLELPLEVGEDKGVFTSMSQLLFSSRWIWKEVIINRNGKIVLPYVVSAEVDPKWGDTTVHYRYSSASSFTSLIKACRDILPP